MHEILWTTTISCVDKITIDEKVCPETRRALCTNFVCAFLFFYFREYVSFGRVSCSIGPDVWNQKATGQFGGLLPLQKWTKLAISQEPQISPRSACFICFISSILVLFVLFSHYWSNLFYSYFIQEFFCFILGKIWNSCNTYYILM